ncbi:CPBP family intramembrane metalloprotease [Nonomuraea diastatica]|uniref:CPBP family intramembrane metalloprotease n=1 Tax=Nonomuraea diastatica TaxID=1848329 RepID=A0A4R4X571_9ACTN|nr:CPBP family intramembrane metalloprotease [Nonomuraea diastatica]
MAIIPVHETFIRARRRSGRHETLQGRRGATPRPAGAAPGVTRGPLGATVVLGPLWGLWHLPLFLSEWGGWPDVTWLRVGEFVAFACVFSVIVTWVFNRTGQSLPLVMLLHVSVNNFMSIVYSDMFPSIATAEHAGRVTLLAGTTAAFLVIVATRGRLGYRPAEEPVQEPSQEITHRR